MAIFYVAIRNTEEKPASSRISEAPLVIWKQRTHMKSQAHITSNQAVLGNCLCTNNGSLLMIQNSSI